MALYEIMIGIIKDLALIFGILVASTSLIVHWKAILRPDLKRVEEQRFRAVERVYSLITDYRLAAIYSAKKAVPAEDLHSLLMDKMEDLPSIFVPERIEKKLAAFMYQITWTLLVPFDEVLQDEEDLVNVYKKVKERIFLAHREVFSETAKWLGFPEKAFPFHESLLGQQDPQADRHTPAVTGKPSDREA